MSVGTDEAAIRLNPPRTLKTPHHTLPVRGSILAAICLIPNLVFGATIEWNNTSTTWTTTGDSSWVGGTAPAQSPTTDIAAFGSQGTSVISPIIVANRSIAGINFLTGAHAYTFANAGNFVLTVGSTGISNSATNIQTFNEGLALNAGQTWTTGLSGLLVLNGTVNITPNTTGGRILEVAGAGNTTFNGVIQNSSGKGSFTAAATGCVTLNNSNTYTGTTKASAGVLKLNHSTALPGGLGSTGGVSNLTFEGGVVGLTTASGDFNRALGSGPDQVQWNESVSGGFAAFGGDRTVNFGGAGASATWLSTGGVFGSGLTLSHSTADSTITIVNPIDLGASSERTIIVNDGSPAVDGILSGVISLATGRLIKDGNGTLALTANNTFGSTPNPNLFTVTISAGTLQLGNGGTSGSITSGGDILNNATLAIMRSDAITIANQISGTGGVTQTGSGTTALTAINTYQGPTIVGSGALQVGNGGVGKSGTGVTEVSSGASIFGTGTVQGSSFTLDSGGSLHVGDSTSQSSYGTLRFTPVSGSGAFDLQSGSSVSLGVDTSGSADKLIFTGTGTNTLTFNNNLTVGPATMSPIAEAVFDLLDWAGLSSSPTFASHFTFTGLLLGNGDEASGLDLPNVSGSGYAWNIGNFTTNGSIALVAVVPEVSRVLMLCLGFTCSFLRRRR